MRILGPSPGVRPFLIQTAPVLDFVHGYQLAGHVIWHGHFLILWSPSKVPLKTCNFIFLNYFVIISYLFHNYLPSRTEDGVRKHMNTTHGTRRFPCKTCNFVFKTSSALKSHELCAHTDIRAFQVSHTQTIYPPKKVYLS